LPALFRIDLVKNVDLSRLDRRQFVLTATAL